MENLYYIALIGNIDNSLLDLDFGDGFTIERMKKKAFIDFFQKMHDLPAYEIEFQIDENYRYGFNFKNPLSLRKSRYVYVIKKDLGEKFLRNPEFSLDHKKNEDELITALNKRDETLAAVSKLLNEKIVKLRLWSEGCIGIGIEVFYTYENGELTFLGSSQYSPFASLSSYELYKVKRKEVKKLNKFLKDFSLNSKYQYLELALHNFNHSYGEGDTSEEFLSLMIALEALLNEGKGELRYKLSRRCAVLLGESISHSSQIFKDVKSLYDKRSKLVHTGKSKEINAYDVILLKNYVRCAIRRAFEINLPKDELLNLLLINGFGAYKKHIKGRKRKKS